MKQLLFVLLILLALTVFLPCSKKLREEILFCTAAQCRGTNSKSDILSESFSREMQALQDWISHIDEELLDKTVEALLNADHILLTGARSSYHAANWFGNRLNLLLGNTHIIQEFYDPRFDLLNHITDKTVVISIAFARYTKWTYRYADSAKKMVQPLLHYRQCFLSFLIFPIIQFLLLR